MKGRNGGLIWGLRIWAFSKHEVCESGFRPGTSVKRTEVLKLWSHQQIHNSTTYVPSALLTSKQMYVFLISNFRLVLNVACFLLGNSPASESYMPTFRNTLFRLHRQVGEHLPAYEDGTDKSVPKRRHIKFRRRGITQKKAYKCMFIVNNVLV